MKVLRKELREREQKAMASILSRAEVKEEALRYFYEILIHFIPHTS